ncbi:MAG: hypothetical protein AB2748_15010 [Candidatus Thiodiazotropha endolucinida]
MSASTLTREELKEVLSEMEFHPEVERYLDSYLRQYVYSKDLEMVKLLLKRGANPNPRDDLDCYLHHLLHEYEVTKTTSGETLLALMSALLEGGANPNRTWCNNWRAYDYAATQHVEPVARLLLQHGASPEIREYV